MTYGFCATTRKGKSVFSLANSRIYVQNLIQFDKSCQGRRYAQTTNRGGISTKAKRHTLRIKHEKV
jgi:hypothetical protein